jgi:transmembrane sensor
MSSETDEKLRMRAIEWHVRLRYGDDATWAAFADWLAVDSRHAEVYAAIEQIDQAIEPLLPKMTFCESAPHAVEAADRPMPRSLRRWWIAGGALAASIAAMAVLIPQLTASRYEVTTGPGERRTIALDATTQVTLNGSTRMTFDHKNVRFASLSVGEALFQIRHDESRPFTLEVGDSRIRDVGTLFNVVRDSGQVRVAVAEGKVIYHTRAQTVPLTAGQILSAPSNSPNLRINNTPVTAVGAWQNGRLVYSGERLSQVAADLERSLGIHIDVSPIVAGRLFSGTIALNGSGARQLERLKLALNVNLAPGPTGWMMTPLDDGGR